MKIDALKLAAFAAKLPAVVAGVMAIVHNVKSASKQDKVDAVIASVPTSFALAEFAAGQDLFDDAGIQKLMAAVAQAKHDLLDAEAALKAGILAKP